MSDDPVIRARVAGNDLDQARSMYEDSYNGDTFNVELTDADFQYRYTVAGNEDMTVRSSMFLGSIRGSIQPQNEYVVSWLSDGAGAVDLGADEASMAIGVPAMFPTGKRFTFDFENYSQSLIHFRAGFLERIAAEHEGSLRAPLHFDHTSVPSAAALAVWKSAVEEAAALILRDQPTPLQLAEANRRTAIALLDTFAHESTPLPPTLLAPAASRIRRAVDLIHAHAHEPLTATGIAEEAGVSVRSLQEGFRAHLGVTPLEYLREVRLERVRAELLHLGPEEAKVAEVAARWGFTHMGRFAMAYTAKFNEYPSATLHR